MKSKSLIRLIALLLLPAINHPLPSLFAQGTEFTYQGQLLSNGALAGGTYNLKFTLFDTNTGGAAIAGPLTNSAVVITDGLFTVTLDFGSAEWNGATNWLQIDVETNGGTGFTKLSPRQRVTPAPYAITAENFIGNLASGSLGGTYSNALVLNNPFNLVSGSFAGNGAGLTNVSAATLDGLAAGNFWQIGGNSGVPTGSNYIGNNDNQYLDFHANGVRAMRLRLLSDGLGIYTNAPNVIGGSSLNQTAPGVVGAFIGGGGCNTTNGLAFWNEVFADFGTIGGGYANSTAGRNATVGGGYANAAQGNGSFVGGGGFDGITFVGNLAQGNASVLGGGLGNVINSNGVSAFIGGGNGNNVSQGLSAICGGYGNSAPNAYVFVGGGFENTASGPLATVSGGGENTASWGYTTIGGGWDNTASGSSFGYSTVGGGATNQASGDYSFIGGGVFHLALADYTTIAGGFGNVASYPYTTVAGGYGNVAAADYAVVTGGFKNRAEGTNATVGGGSMNWANGAYATVEGGYSNNAAGDGAFIGGGGFDRNFNTGNLAAGTASTISGGANNSVYSAATYGTIAGGYENYVAESEGTIGGGEDNEVNSSLCVIGGGLSNNTGQYLGSGIQCATVGGGYDNAADGSYSTIPGGLNNGAFGEASLAAGNNAIAAYDGSFIWSDDTGTLTEDTAKNQFVARASGGFYFYSGTGSSGTKLPAGATAWTTLCDRNAKKNFQPLDTVAVLNKLAAVPIERWNYKWEADDATPNIGPMAQDFKAAFYPGRDDKTISTLEFDGVEIAAIQGLNRKLEARLKEKEVEISDLKARLERIERLLNSQKGPDQ